MHYSTLAGLIERRIQEQHTLKCSLNYQLTQFILPDTIQIINPALWHSTPFLPLHHPDLYSLYHLYTIMTSRSSLVALRTAVRSRTAVAIPAARSLRTSTALRAGNPSIPEASKAPFSEPVGINPADKLAPLNSPLHEYGQYLTTCLPKYVQQFSVYKDELTLYIPPQAVVPVLTFLRDHTQCQYKAVMDITAVDYPTRQNRFEASPAQKPSRLTS